MGMLAIHAAAYGQERRIQPGDRITITVLDREDLTRTVVVRPDGTVQYPFIGSENLTGFTLDQLRAIITIQLTRSLGRPPQAVDVLWAEDTVIDQFSVAVLGQVVTPGIVTVERNAGLQGALQNAGGVLPGARRNDIKLHRVTSEGTVVIPVDLERFLESGDLGYLPDLQDGDVIVVPGGTLSTAARVLGGVETPGAYQIPAGATVFDMILQAGGFTDDARMDKVRLIKPSTGVTEEYTIDMAEFFRTGQRPASPPVEPGDTIIVQKRLLTYRRVFDGIRDVASILSIASFIVVITR
jgi:protein involved in polysaccharide export with SLBB domain